MGMGRECGAVTGAMMVLGFQVKEGSTEKETRFKVYELNRELVRRFERKHGTIVCGDLLGVDLGTQEGRDKAVKDGLFRTLCPGYVRDAAQILSDIKV
jgi:C_GCAxxG_C_C family probable redox protein